MACLDADGVLAYLDNALPAPERAAAERHMDACAPCRRLISDLARGTDVLGRLTPSTALRMGEALSATVRPEPRAGGGAGAGRLDDLALPSIPTAAGDLEVRAVLGEGGMGRVLLAHQRSLGRDVALKSILPQRRSPEAEAALLSEGRCAGGLEHPNIVPVHALGRDQDGGAVLILKRLEGTSWRERLREEGLERNLEILIQVCNAVHFAHDRGVLHRDIKPDNVMLGAFGEVTLVDWGVALRLAEREGATEVAGTPRYLAPEMLQGGLALSPRTDVYLLGATLFEILTGRPPHGGGTLREVLASVAAPTTPGLQDGSVPEVLAAICQKALDPAPERRFGSAEELRDALVGFLRHQASGRMAEQALARLVEAQRSEVPALRRRLLYECQFGLRQALREWPGSPAAQRGLADCVAEMARLEIGEGNRGAAELLVAELAAPPPELLAALSELRTRQEAEVAGQRRLQAIEHDRDFGVSRRARLALAAGVVAANLLSAVPWFLSQEPPTVAPAELVRTWVIGVMIMLVVVVLARRALLKNLVNRQVILSILLASGGLILHGVLSLWRGQPVEETLAESMGMIGVALALLALFAVRWIAVVAALTFAAAVAATLRPQATFPLWMAVTTLPFVGMIVIWWRPSGR